MKKIGVMTVKNSIFSSLINLRFALNTNWNKSNIIFVVDHNNVHLNK